jgi:hypothetical protein
MLFKQINSHTSLSLIFSSEEKFKWWSDSLKLLYSVLLYEIGSARLIFCIHSHKRELPAGARHMSKHTLSIFPFSFIRDAICVLGWCHVLEPWAALPLIEFVIQRGSLQNCASIAYLSRPGGDV